MRFSLLAILLIGACASGSGQARAVVASGQADSPDSLGGSREEQVAQALAAIVPVSASRDWAAARAAFPDARWEERTSDTTPTVVRDGITYPGTLDTNGYTDSLEGSIDLNGARLRIEILGTPERVTMIRLNAPEGMLVGRAALRRALAARGVVWRLIRCNPIGDANVPIIVELSAGGQSTIFEDTFSGEASAYEFSFDGGLYDPADPPGDCPDEVRNLR